MLVTQVRLPPLSTQDFPLSLDYNRLMNERSFHQLLEQLDDAAWQAVVNGAGIILADDARLQINEGTTANSLIQCDNPTQADADSLKQSSLANSSALLTQYYTRHPLSLIGFNNQVSKLIGEFGINAFTARTGEVSMRTLFVDSGKVFAEPADSPRHCYGVFCELSDTLSDTDIEDFGRKWLENGEAYQQYLSMNVCRYNC